jgi:hypothetical protein
LKTASLNLLIPQICVQYAKYIDRENKKRWLSTKKDLMLSL